VVPWRCVKPTYGAIMLPRILTISFITVSLAAGCSVDNGKSTVQVAPPNNVSTSAVASLSQVTFSPRAEGGAPEPALVPEDLRVAPLKSELTVRSR
jgi:hypothetical protein